MAEKFNTVIRLIMAILCIQPVNGDVGGLPPTYTRITVKWYN